MGLPLRSEFATENHSKARSSKPCKDQRTDQTAFFLAAAPIITDFIRNTTKKLYDEKLEDAPKLLNQNGAKTITPRRSATG